MNPIYDFIKKYYIDSIVYKQGYNPVNTITFAIILVIAIVLLYRYLKKLTGFDKYFVFSNIPFIILGSSVRIIEDAEFLTPPVSYFFMTPFIYIIIFLITFPSLVISIKLRKEEYWKYHVSFGSILALSVLAFLFTSLQPINIWLIPIVLTSALIMTVLYGVITNKIYPKMDNLLSKTVFFAQMTDGFASFLGIQFLGYWELHVLPRLLIDTFGPWIMVPAKILVFIAVIYLLDSSEEDENFVNFIKFALIVLGLAPGVRNALRMTFSV